MEQDAGRRPGTKGNTRDDGTMYTAETGGAGHRLGPAIVCLSAVLALAFVVAIPGALADSKKPAAVEVPLPTPRPTTDSALEAAASPDDAIGALIAASPDENRATEDSDAPQAYAATDTDDLPPAPTPAPAVPASLNSAGLKLALKFLDDDDPAAATVAAYALPDPVDIKIIDWLVAVSGSRAVSPSRIQAVARKLPDWPGQSLLCLFAKVPLILIVPVVVSTILSRKLITPCSAGPLSLGICTSTFRSLAAICFLIPANSFSGTEKVT